MKFYYGVDGNYTDITIHVYEKCIKNGVLEIPSDDEVRAMLFGDHIFGVLKHIKIVDDNDNSKYYILLHFETLKLNIDQLNINNVLKEENYSNLKKWWNSYGKKIDNYEKRLLELHEILKIKHGKKNDEYIEQYLSIKHIKPESKVIELGSNIGRNSCVIATVLDDDRNLVTLETCASHVLEVTDNKQINGFHFHIEPRALSKRNLIQSGWTTIESDKVLDGYFKVDTISLDNLNQKYNIKFDTLVADCEGALYYILKDEPTFLDNIHTVIVENDYTISEHAKFVEKQYIEKGFKLVERYKGGLNFHVCRDNFYEVWKKMNNV